MTALRYVKIELTELTLSRRAKIPKEGEGIFNDVRETGYISGQEKKAIDREMFIVAVGTFLQKEMSQSEVAYF